MAKTFAEKFIGKVEFEGLDLEFPYYSKDEPNDVLVQNNKLVLVEKGMVSMNIDDAISALNKLKELGSNRVYIGTNPQHCEYCFYGMVLKEI